MKLNVKRVFNGDGYTIGHFYIDDTYLCDTLEDTVRDLTKDCSQKVYGQTAIPEGTYKVETVWWEKHKAYYPHLMNVKCFEGILIHCGNTASDTEGCILLGENDSKGHITNGRPHWEYLMTKLSGQTNVTITVEDKPKPSTPTTTPTVQPQTTIPTNNTYDWSTLRPIDVSKIVAVDFPNDKYYPIEYPKKVIVLHHTVSGPGVRGDIEHWVSLSDRIATCIIIDDKGIANQCFSSKYWAHHLGVKASYLQQQGFTDWSTRNVELNRSSIAVEIDNWGGLVLGDGTAKQFGVKDDGTPNMVTTETGQYYAAYGNKVQCDVQYYPTPFRGYNYYHKYTQGQIKTVGELLLLWHIKYGIPLDYHTDMWDISKDALSGVPGIWTHVNYRTDKSDTHPQPELIEMLKTLKSLT